MGRYIAHSYTDLGTVYIVLQQQQQQHNIERIRQILGKVTMYTVRQLARMTNLPLARVHCILKKHLGLRKINAR